MSLARFSVTRPVTVLMITIGICVFGFMSIFQLPVELKPDISYKQITIQVSLRGGGLPPEETESLVIKPIEDAVGGVGALDKIVSTAEKERAIVRLFFNPGTDMDFASLEVREAFSKVKNKMPSIAEKPVIAKFEESDKPVIILAVTSLDEIHSPEEMRTIVDQKLKEKLMRVPGVANVQVIGGRLQKVITNLDQKVIQSNKIPIRKVVNKIGVNTMNVQVGSRDDDQYRKGIQFRSEFRTIEEISNTQVISDNITKSQFLIKDIGKVDIDYMEAKELARLTDFKDKDEGPKTSNIVTLRVQKESTGNTVKVSENVKLTLEQIEKDLSKNYPDLRVLTVNDQAKMILEAIQQVKSNLLQGALFAFIVLMIFLMNFRVTLVIAIAMPVSLLLTFLLMQVSGITLNVYTLLGLAVGVGMLLDNSIVVVENIFKKRDAGHDATESAIKGTEEVTSEIISGTMTTVVAFVPLFFLPEQIKQLYGSIAQTVIGSLISSLFASLMIVPTLCAKFKLQTVTKKTISPFEYTFRRRYSNILSFCLRYRMVTVFLILSLLVLSYYFLTNIPQELSGESEQRSFTVFVELPDGAKLEASDEVVSEIEALLRKKEDYPDIESVTSNVEGWSSKVFVNVVPRAERQFSIPDIIENLRENVPKLNAVKKMDAFVYYSEDGGEEASEVNMDVYGPNYEELKKLANEVAAKMEEVEGMKDAKLAMTEGRPEFWIIPRRIQAGDMGLTTQEIAEVIHAKIQGLRATAFHPDDGSGQEIETLVRLDPKYLQTLEDVKKLAVMSPRNQLVPLKFLADFEVGQSPSEIWRTDKSRMVGISATSTKLVMEEAINRIKEKVSAMTFPKDYYFMFGGGYYKMLEQKKQFTLAILTAVLLVYMVLACQFESYFYPLLIMLMVPLSLIGSSSGLFYKKQAINMGVLMGAIMLAGIVVNSAIILVSTVNHFRFEKKLNLMRANITAGLSRLRPIMMTSLTTILGIAPMVFDKSAFSQLWSPLAITFMCGLISATVLTLFILPSITFLMDNINEYFKKFLQSAWTATKILIVGLLLLNSYLSILLVLKVKQILTF